jgi:Phenylalanyl-tRNA synthetase beta subunit
VERKLHADDLMICDGESNPMCIAGVFGGLNSGVTESTTRIFLECAVFNPAWIRRTMIRHGLRTDSAWAFEKGVDPGDNNSDAMFRGSLLIEKLTGGKITTEYVELQPELPKPNAIQMRFDRINALIGEELPKERILQILTALNMPQSELSDEGFIVWVNTNKPDVSREADVVEEILRLHGLDNVPIPAQIRSSIEVQPRPNPVAVQNLAADFLAANGFNECMSLSLTNSAYFLGDGAALPIAKERLVFIHNSANQGLDCMRPTMLFSSLEAIQRNQNRQNPDLRLFEMGKIYENAEAGKAAKETAMLALFLTGAHSHESWQPSPKKTVDFYTLKAQVTKLLARLGIAGYQETTLSGEAPFQYALKLHRGPQTLAVIGSVMPQVLKKMDIKNPVFYAECHFDNLLKGTGKPQNTVCRTQQVPHRPPRLGFGS